MPLSSSLRITSLSSTQQVLQGAEEIGNDLKSNLARVHHVSNCVIYSPFSNKDMVIQAMGINTTRMLKGKEPLPIVCSIFNRGMLKSAINEFKDKELQGRLKDGAFYEKKISPYIESLGVKNVHDAFPLETKRLGEYRSINRLEVVDPKTITDKSIESIYVIGHGEAGRPHLYETAKCNSGSQSIADVISDINSLLRFKVKVGIKIKMTACESADRETLVSFDKTHDNSQRRKGIEPLAKSAKTEVDKLFTAARVFGYHGLGVSRGSDYISQARCLEADFDKKKGSISQWIKSSAVRTEF
ncbi:hypothetical protein CKQ84_18930 [Shewanella sp. WE21]|jgi:hypothetical protein|uniref:hypothetical protein n=1 Tax=Shewanella sp. WE21 TaxID=2029986 RepID=UPI000CF6F38B|nr:hypothetical protein [Shewanella sp. WE21]AVI67751.1 hypothetical protein CKQ84_18930 [Shewanella sp. WE21]